MLPGQNLILESAYLRGQTKFDDSIALIESNIDKIHPDIKVIAWLEAFNAAKEKGDHVQAKKFALLVAIEEPELPSIQAYL